MGQPLYCSAARCWCVGSAKLWRWLHPLLVTQQHCLASMAARLSSTGISHCNLLRSPRPVFPQSTAALTLGLFYNPYTPAASYCAFQRTCIPLCCVYGCGKDCLTLIPFRLPQISCFTLSFVSPLTQTIASCGDRTPASVPPPVEGRSSLTNTPVFPPSSFILPSFVGVYILFSSGQLLLSALSWCSACTSVSEGVLLMCPWREMYSLSAYSSAIFFFIQ